jgi:hypothetical protein
MKTILSLITFLTIANAQAAADVQVTPCPKNSQILYVEINGESAINIFTAIAGRFNLKPADLISIETNGMLCKGLSFAPNGDATSVKCSYVMVGRKNIPYPQTDVGFSGEEKIVCE